MSDPANWSYSAVTFCEVFKIVLLVREFERAKPEEKARNRRAEKR